MSLIAFPILLLSKYYIYPFSERVFSSFLKPFFQTQILILNPNISFGLKSSLNCDFFLWWNDPTLDYLRSDSHNVSSYDPPSLFTLGDASTLNTWNWSPQKFFKLALKTVQILMSEKQNFYLPCCDHCVLHVSLIWSNWKKLTLKFL